MIFDISVWFFLNYSGPKNCPQKSATFTYLRRSANVDHLLGLLFELSGSTCLESLRLGEDPAALDEAQKTTSKIQVLWVFPHPVETTCSSNWIISPQHPGKNVQQKSLKSPTVDNFPFLKSLPFSNGVDCCWELVVQHHHVYCQVAQLGRFPSRTWPNRHMLSLKNWKNA